MSQAGGENRLNVAVSRARQKVIVVTSIQPEDLKVEQTKNKGPKQLKSYLQYARKVSEKEMTFSMDDDQSHGQAWYLKRRIQTWEKEMPIKFNDQSVYADLILQRRGKYVAALTTDDDRFYQSVSNKEMFAYDPAIFESKGWPYLMMHSRRYWRQKEQMKERLNQFVESNLD